MECGVDGCWQERTGSLPESTLLQGVLVLIEGERRLPVCNHHGREHHSMWLVGWTEN